MNPACIRFQCICFFFLCYALTVVGSKFGNLDLDAFGDRDWIRLIDLSRDHAPSNSVPQLLLGRSDDSDSRSENSAIPSSTTTEGSDDAAEVVPVLLVGRTDSDDSSSDRDDVITAPMAEGSRALTEGSRALTDGSHFAEELRFRAPAKLWLQLRVLRLRRLAPVDEDSSDSKGSGAYSPVVDSSTGSESNL